MTNGRISHSSPIWVHAVSVGEVIAAVPLLRNLREKYPSRTILLSTITDTGQKVARARAPEGTIVIYLPFDIPSVVARVMKTVCPELLIIMETELWPNLFKICASRKIPVILMNGRISENSFRGYRRISFFMRKVLSCVEFFGMQNDEYAARIRSLGVAHSRIMSLGNFKFDATPPAQIPEWTKRLQKPVLIAGSTNEGEEELITSVHLQLKKDFPALNLILAPRHPERFDEVATMIASKNIPYMRRSALDEQPIPPPPAPSPLEGEGRGGGGLKSPVLPEIKGTVILLDTVGELSAVYGASDIAIIGKSFAGYGGQNPLEPASWGKAILCGPHMENFPVIREFYNAGAAIEVSAENLHATLRELLMSPEKAVAMGSRARDLYRRNSGAVGRAMEVLAKYL
ncbi:MAG: 3-deoxy-D-manno-octulosonic acid transferase [Thermodesulfovibrionales bacterium]|nr:3-deoxy-D-manno-octulosonic acid transferase [Thermodesulfovibrionales bacterium]